MTMLIVMRLCLGFYEKDKLCVGWFHFVFKLGLNTLHGLLHEACCLYTSSVHVFPMMWGMHPDDACTPLFIRANE
jgi:hypothetical protein